MSDENEYAPSEDDFQQEEASAPLSNIAATNPEGSITAKEAKEVIQELLRYGYMDEQSKPVYFRRAIVRQSEIATALEPLDLALRLDEHRGVAFLVVAPTAHDPNDEDGEWSHPLIRRQRLTFEQSLVIAILRQVFVLHEQEAGVGGASARVAVEDLLPQFLTYFSDSGSDAKNESRLSILLDQLKTYGIVSEVDKNGEFIIRPLIAHLANPSSLAALLASFEEKSSKPETDAPEN
jgi:hypothetical protein